MKRKSVSDAGNDKKRPATPAAAKRQGETATRESAVSRPSENAGRRYDGHGSISAEERLQMIRRLAYLKAEKRGFQGGSALEDWLQAEAEVDAQLGPSAAKSS